MKQSLKQLDEIFDDQARALTESANETLLAEERSLIRFSINGSIFAVGIDKVMEVTELTQIVPYPEPHYSHLGIANLRGQLTPVLAFGEQPQGAETRLLVLEFTPGRRFCTPVSAPKKVSLAGAENEPTARIVSIDGMPVRLVTEQDFPAIQQIVTQGEK